MFRKQFLKLALFLTTLFVTVSGSETETVNDSASYCKLRKQYVQKDENSPVIRTADALAQEGFFTEAADVILASAKGPAKEKNVKSTSGSLWQLSTGIDYSRLEEVDSAAMTLEELQDYRRLTRIPLSIWARARRTIGLGENADVRPEIHLSGYKSRLEIPFKMQFAQNRYTVQMAPKGEKWFSSTVGTPNFRPFKTDSSDMGGAALSLLYQNTNSETSWSLPFVMDWEHYRFDRSGYESFVEYHTAPFFEYRSDDQPLSASISGELRLTDYYGTWADTLDLIEGTVSARTTFTKKNYSVLAESHYLKNVFVNTQALSQTDRVNMSARIGFELSSHISSQLFARGLYLSEEYEQYSLRSKELLIRPEIRFTRGTFFTQTELSVQNRWASEVNSQFIWQPGVIYEPILRSGVSFKTFDLSLFAGCRRENVKESFEKFIPDSKSIKAGVNGSYSFCSGWMIFGLIDYQYRMYDNTSRRSENITVSLSAAAEL